MQTQTLFRSGQGGYASYRIPTLISLPGGRVIAFCEGRLNSSRDFGTIRILCRVSCDGGKSFSPQRVIAQNDPHTIGNPTPVYDADTGILWLFLNGNLADGPESEIMKNKAPRSVLLTRSRDLGNTWEPLADLTGTMKRPGWTWHAFGPCHGIQTSKGHLLVPANHAVYDPAKGTSDIYRSHVVYSTDHGATWQLGGEPGDHTNECSLAELADGRLYLNMRSYAQRGCRQVSYSGDGGLTWTSAQDDPALIEPVCQGSVLAHPIAFEGCARPLLFSNPAHRSERENLTLRMSLDGGSSWKYARGLCPGKAAYSDLAALPDGQVACFYECGEEHCYERLDFSAFPLEWMARDD